MARHSYPAARARSFPCPSKHSRFTSHNTTSRTIHNVYHPRCNHRSALPSVLQRYRLTQPTGVGGVGKTFISQLAGYAARNPSTTISTILISRSSKALVSKSYSPINLSTWETDLAASTTAPLAFPAETISFLAAAPGPVILVDNTSDESIAAAYPAFLRKGIHIVTPNKKGFSGNIAHWKDIYAASRNGGNKEGGYVFHEATVGAGLPVLSTLKELVETGDKVKKIEGIFSGTMSFLFNSFAPLGGDNGGKGFTECVKEARDLGYTVWEFL